MDNVSIVESIKSLCKRNNITVSQLEKNIGLSQGLVSKWVNTTPSFDKIIDIADYFHVSLDEVVGYRNTKEDKFLEKLVTQTVDKTINWNKYNKDVHEQPLHYHNPDIDADPEDFIDIRQYYDFLDTHKEISYFVKIHNVYILLYACYKYQNIVNPFEINLFIQPGNESDLVEQDYTYEQLKVLWLKVLYTLGDNAPDEIKVEEFKNSFINDFKKPEPIKKKKKIIVVTNPPNSQTQQRQQFQRKNIVRPVADIKQLDPQIADSIANTIENFEQTETDSNNNNISQTEE